MTQSPPLKWLPDEWQDEVNPVAQDSPAAFLRKHETLGWIILPVEQVEPEDNDHYPIRLEPGQIVAFSAHENYGKFRMTVTGDRRFDVSPPVPEKANCFYVDGDFDTFNNRLDILVNGDGTEWTAPLDPGPYELTAYWWSETSTYFRFMVDAAGEGSFEPCAGPN